MTLTLMQRSRSPGRLSKRIGRFCAPLVLASVALVSSCANMTETEQTTAKGAGIGAVAGAAIGALAGGGRGAAIGAGVGAAAGAAGGYIWSQKMEEQKRSMEQATSGTGVAVTQTADNQLKLEVPSDVSFDVGRADIKPNFRPILDKFAQGLTSNPAATVRIIGHTDSSGTDAINNPLSVNRASSVRDYLVDRGVATSRIAIDGRGSREPIADNSTDAGRAKNRRVEIFVAEQAAGGAPAR
jgi:outer membrane protein OmpA-like peptidoglycan-associated protein